MNRSQINELKNSYYEYIVKIPEGLEKIVNLLENNELEKALDSLSNLAEGLVSLLKIEQVLVEYNLRINSRITEVVAVFDEINNSLENQDYILLKDLIEYEIIPAFSSASEWIFQEEVK